MRFAAALLVVLVACQGNGGGEPAPAGSGSARPGSAHPAGFGARDAGVTSDAQADEGSGSGSASGPGSDSEGDPVDVGKAIADLGAISAWQAVVDRAQYLARRGQHGIVFGTVGAAVVAAPTGSASPGGPASVANGVDAGLVATPYTWLVDDTEGNGSLAIRVELGARAAKIKAGDRVALGGAWMTDEAHGWFWMVDAVTPLPAAPPPSAKDPPSQLGHAIGSGDMPRGAKPISKAGDGDLVYFQLVGAPPALDGDGWPVADELGNPVAALIDLPGETASYGGQDLRTPDERWHLKRGVTYALRVAVVHHHGPDKPATMRARTAPIKVM
ncbi:MAG TPA: hypothetical protein VMJ10_24325 [Kofleriaceae bacterium]|nr:hypothetical protein [Kofleriaceae bacterium]